LAPTALAFGAFRIIPGLSITYPLGDPSVPPSREKEVRRTIVLKALESLQSRILEKQVFGWQ
jgi:glycine reductase